MAIIVAIHGKRADKESMASTLPNAEDCCDPCALQDSATIITGVGTLTGASNPNGVLTAIIGTVYTQVVGAVVTVWVNTDGATAWS